MKDISAEELVEFLNGAPQPLRYTRKEISGVLKKVAEAGDDSAFGKVIDAYIDFTKRYWEQENAGSQCEAVKGALENMACAAVIADRGLVQPIDLDQHLYNIYKNPNKQGLAMKALIRHLGWDKSIAAERLLELPVR